MQFINADGVSKAYTGANAYTVVQDSKFVTGINMGFFLAQLGMHSKSSFERIPV